MIFPTTPLLDQFTGSDQNPITTNWSGPAITGQGQLQRLSNQLTQDSSVDAQSGWFNPRTFGPDFEAYITYGRISNNVGDSLILGYISPAPDGNWYGIQHTFQSGTDFVALQRNGSDIGAQISQEFAAGDSLGVRKIGPTLEAWYKASAGVWTQIGARTDATYSFSGNIWIRMFGADAQEWIVDDLGGGTIVLGPYSPPVIGGRGAC